SARGDRGARRVVTTQAEAAGSSSGRGRLSGPTTRITTIPIVADWAAVRQNRAPSVTGCGSLTASEKLDSRATREVPGFSTRRWALVTPASMAKITGEVPFGCRPLSTGLLTTGAVKNTSLNLHLSGTASVKLREISQYYQIYLFRCSLQGYRQGYNTQGCVCEGESEIAALNVPAAISRRL